MARSVTRVLVASIVTSAVCVTANGQSTTLVSVGSGGSQSSFNSYESSISSDGHFIAFRSGAWNLVPGDTNSNHDIFVRDTQTGQTTRVSVDSSGAQGNDGSANPSISSDGRFITFDSLATNLVPVDTNGRYDVFVHDRQSGTTTCVSVDSGGTQSNSDSLYPSISADGRYIAFYSNASNLVPGDTNVSGDVFMHDMQAGVTTRMSVDSTGMQGNLGAYSYAPSISTDGRFVAFTSRSLFLVPGDNNGYFDVFVHDTQTGQTMRVSVDSAGTPGDDNSFASSISADGRFVAFCSDAANLVPGDTNIFRDVFVHDTQTGVTTRVSVDSSGAQGNIGSANYIDTPSISANGGFVAFYSLASNLVPGDTNGFRDAFVHNMQTGVTTRVSVDSAGTQGNSASGIYGNAYPPAISSDGRFVSFSSAASNLVTGDANNWDDVFVREWLHACYLDADLDGFGTGSAIYSPTGCGTGYAANASDCDDTNASVHPSAIELCNGIDDNCDGLIDEGFISAYCTSSTTTHSCTPLIAGTGTPDSTQSTGFNITVTGVEGQKNGLIFYGTSPTAVAWAIGSFSYVCVAPPVQRTAIINSGGTLGGCDGGLTIDFNSFMASNPTAYGSPFMAGEVFFAQGWFRDSGAVKGTNLSNGLQFQLCN